MKFVNLIRCVKVRAKQQHILIQDDEFRAESVRFLIVDGAIQTAVFLDPKKKYELVSPYLDQLSYAFSFRPDIKDTLLLGGGGFAYPAYYISHYPERRIDAVEIDGEMIKAAMESFYLRDLLKEFGMEEKDVFIGGTEILSDVQSASMSVGGQPAASMSADQQPVVSAGGGRQPVTSMSVDQQPVVSAGGGRQPVASMSSDQQSVVSAGGGRQSVASASSDRQYIQPRLRIYNKDALNYLLSSDLQYDFIIEDAYDGRRAAGSLRSDDGIRVMRSHLRKGGILAVNVVAARKGPLAFREHETEMALRRHFRYVAVMPCEEDISTWATQNCLMFASDEEL